MQFFTHKGAGAIQVSGEDALPYLQSQLTIDLHSLSPLATRYGLRLNLKGRVLFGAQIIRAGEEEFWMICRDTPTRAILSCLEENIVADEVEFSEVPGEWSLTTLLGDSSENGEGPPRELCLPAPGTALQTENGWIYPDPRMPGPAHTLLHPADCNPAQLEGADEIGSFALEKRRLEAQLFRPGWEVAEDAFPQEAGLEKGAVDFDKGCYLGQEVMARIHSMGNVRKRTVMVRGSGEACPNLPVPLLLGEKEVGALKSQFHHPQENFWIGAALVHEKALPSLETEGLEQKDHAGKVFLHPDE